jgi:hypothetical protein
MTQSELSGLIMSQCSRYGEPSTLRALIPFLLAAAPKAVPFVVAAAKARAEFYRANGIGHHWRRQKWARTHGRRGISKGLEIRLGCRP